MAAVNGNGWGRIVIGAVFGGLSSLTVAFGVMLPTVPSRSEMEIKIEKAVESAPVVVDLKHVERVLEKLDQSQRKLWVALTGVEEELARLDERVAQLVAKASKEQ